EETRQQIQDELRRLNAQVNVGGAFAGGRGGGRGGGGGGALQSVTASVSAPAENFPAALNLAAEILREPLYSSVEFDRVREQRIKALELTPTEPNQLAGDVLTRHMSPFSKNDPQYVPTREEELAGMKNATLESARALHTQFYGADHGILAVVGPVEPAAVQKQAAELFATWKSKAAYKQLVTPYKKVAPINEKIETPDKANAEFMAQARFQ